MPKCFSQVIYIENDKLFGNIDEGAPETDSLISVVNNEGRIIAEGHFAVSDLGVSNIRVGHWKEYYDNGVLKNEGLYKIGSFVDCCMGGACQVYYYYRSGKWAFYSKEGILKYKLDYEPVPLKIKTRCEGGDNLLYGLVTKIPLQYSDLLTTDDLYELQKIYHQDDNGVVVYTPLNGELKIEFQPN